jgi:hypothetical protein
MNNQNHTFDYLKAKAKNKSQLSRTANQNELEVKKYAESPNFMKSTHGATSNLGNYNTKTFYTVNQPKRAGTSLSTYQDELNRKRAINEFRNKNSIPNGSNKGAAFYPNFQKDDDSEILHYSGNFNSSQKSNEKVFLPINEVLNQARIDQASSNNATISEVLKNISSGRRNKHSLLENINSTGDKKGGMMMRPTDIIQNDQTITYDDLNEFKNLNLLNIQKSVLASTSAEKRESRPNHTMSNDAFSKNIANKPNSS